MILKQMYYKIVPSEKRIAISMERKKKQVSSWLQNNIEKFPIEDKEEVLQISDFIKNKGFAMLPYERLLHYDGETYDIYRDEEGYPYVLRNDKRPFFVKDWDENKCTDY